MDLWPCALELLEILVARVDQVLAISATDPTKCIVIMSGGVTIPCSESAKDVIAKLEAASSGKQE